MTEYSAEEADIEASRAPLLDHLMELRNRLLVACAAVLAGTVVCYLFAQRIYSILQLPYRDVVARMGGEEALSELTFLVTQPLEQFFTYMKLALVGGVAIASPVLIWQLYAFVAPGLYRRERAAVAPFLLAAPVMFALGGMFVYYVALPFAFVFALGMQGETAIPVELKPKVNEYFGFVTTLLLAFGACFQLPVVLAILAKVGLVGATALRKGRRFAVVGIAAFAACFTPPDVVSMAIMAIPVYLLYEASIWLVWAIERARLKSEAKLAEQAGLAAP